MNQSGVRGSVRGVRVWRALGDAAASFSEPANVTWEHGRFDEVAAPTSLPPSRPGEACSTAPGEASSTTPGAGEIDGTDLWLIPGLVDAHVHAGWQAFNEDERRTLSAAHTRELVAQGLRRTLAAGFTSARDAGGLSIAALQAVPPSERPRVQLAGELIDRAAADRAGGLERAAAAALERGAQWIKLVATAGVASPAGSGLEAHFTDPEMRRAAALAASAGAGVMVHAWGGAAIDHAIEAAAVAPTSLEHGIFLTRDQAERAAQAGLTFVPTLRIYSLVLDMIAAGSLPQCFEPRVREAVRAHPNAVRIARDAGLTIALGSDYGTPDQHGTGCREFEALEAAGLSAADALVAATRGGAELMARVDPDQNRALAGRIAPGAPADAVLLTRDPREAGALSDPGAIAAVILAGRVVAQASFERNPS